MGSDIVTQATAYNQVYWLVICLRSGTNMLILGAPTPTFSESKTAALHGLFLKHVLCVPEQACVRAQQLSRGW